MEYKGRNGNWELPREEGFRVKIKKKKDDSNDINARSSILRRWVSTVWGEVSFSVDNILGSKYTRQTQARASQADILGCNSMKVEKKNPSMKAPQSQHYGSLFRLGNSLCASKHRLATAITDIELFISFVHFFLFSVVSISIYDTSKCFNIRQTKR